MRSQPVRWTTLILAAAFAAVTMLVSLATPSSLSALIATASAQPCQDVEVVFARGQDEPPGMGMIGDAFVNVLRRQKPVSKSQRTRLIILPRTRTSPRASPTCPVTSNRWRPTAPNTKLVVGGYSLGGGVTNEVLANRLPPGADQHVAAVVTFGNASRLVGATTVARSRSTTARGTTCAIQATRSVRAETRCSHTFSSPT